ncbi:MULTISPECIES: TetR/AcrR family transcriptional regulator [Amycolatopsis]|uniref:TetR/AcrR family transcriptional regulator, acrAB operon repressor n=2 Tax=Amycolatopsis TaxID=1813 RepID=A0A1I3UMX4_9PSEU|nr:TetR/AcrR family transcriptional regulator [Amycolatopsis sacchari]SFJ83191.1 TetR/AcrR family transcriptional regulator, acrAB operon repressor [Amycolatopsis sacchari]
MSSPGRRRIDEIGDESRRRILDAAEELFAERGFDRTSFVDIAERSGISRGSIPWHFKNKDGLLMAVLMRAIDRFMGSEQYRTLPSLAKLLADYAAWVRSGNSALMFMVLTEAMSSTGGVHDQYLEFLRDRRDGVELWLRAQRPEGADPDVAAAQERATAVALNGAAIGIHLQALIDPEGVDLEASLQSLAALVDKNLPDVWATPPAKTTRRKTTAKRKRTG